MGAPAPQKVDSVPAEAPQGPIKVPGQRTKRLATDGRSELVRQATSEAPKVKPLVRGAFLHIEPEFHHIATAGEHHETLATSSSEQPARASRQLGGTVSGWQTGAGTRSAGCFHRVTATACPALTQRRELLSRRHQSFETCRFVSRRSTVGKAHRNECHGALTTPRARSITGAMSRQHRGFDANEPRIGEILDALRSPQLFERGHC